MSKRSYISRKAVKNFFVSVAYCLIHNYFSMYLDEIVIKELNNVVPCSSFF